MCGIVGYAGYGDAKAFLLGALHDLEYRGYDSAGIAAITGNGITTIKRAGRVADLRRNREWSFSRRVHWNRAYAVGDTRSGY